MPGTCLLKLKKQAAKIYDPTKFVSTLREMLRKPLRIELIVPHEKIEWKLVTICGLKEICPASSLYVIAFS